MHLIFLLEKQYKTDIYYKKITEDEYLISSTFPLVTDFRYIYPFAFFIVNFLSLSAYTGWGWKSLVIYILLSIVFFIAFFCGVRLVTNYSSKKFYSSSRINIYNSLFLFFISQVFYVKYIYLFFVSSVLIGVSFENYRISVEDSVNLYFGRIAYVLLVMSLVYVILYAIDSMHSNDKSGKIKYILLSIFLFLLSVFELALAGSRATVMSLLFVVFIVLIKFNIISRKILVVSSCSILFMLGWSAYLRISRDIETLRWWVDQGIIQHDSSPIVISLRMIWRTFYGIGQRTMVLFDALLDKIVPHQYGYDTFFFFVSMLPGKQINPSIWLNHNLFFGSDQDVGYPPTIIVQAFWDFSFIGIPLLGFFIGLIGAWLFNRAHSCSIVWVILYALFLEQCFLSLYGEFRLGWFLANIILFVSFDYFLRGRIRI